VEDDAQPRRKALVLDRDPFEDSGRRRSISAELLQKLADAELVVVVKGDEARIIKLRWDDPLEFDVEVVRP
jgi:hypothetical protein